MAKKTTPKEAAQADTTAVEQAAYFTPCRQCGNPGSCARAAKCSKGFK
jgi:hypothetical protein